MNNVVAVAEGRQPPTRTGEALANSATQVATNAAIAKGSMRAAQSIPFFGSLLSFAQTAKMGHDMNAQMQALNAKASATQRKYHLVGLYNQKDCR